MTPAYLWLPVLIAILGAACTSGDLGKTPDPQVVQQLQRILAFETDKMILELLDDNPGLIAASLTSPKMGEMSVLAFAAIHRPNFETIFPQLLKRGADPSSAQAPAALRDKWIVLQKLLQAGAHPDTGDALILAASGRNSRMVEMLLEAGADPNRRATKSDELGHAEQTAMHMAAV